MNIPPYVSGNAFHGMLWGEPYYSCIAWVLLGESSPQRVALQEEDSGHAMYGRDPPTRHASGDYWHLSLGMSSIPLALCDAVGLSFTAATVRVQARAVSTYEWSKT